MEFMCFMGLCMQYNSFCYTMSSEKCTNFHKFILPVQFDYFALGNSCVCNNPLNLL